MPSEIALVAAVADNGVIGQGGALPWRIPSDLARFKALTTGHAVIVGRRTFAEIGRPLPNRRTIVLTRHPLAGVECAGSLGEALARIDGPAFIAGGAAVYAEGMRLADTLHITRVRTAPAGDTLFPPIPDQFVRVAAAPQPQGPRDAHEIVFETWRRRAAAPLD